MPKAQVRKQNMDNFKQPEIFVASAGNIELQKMKK